MVVEPAVVVGVDEEPALTSLVVVAVSVAISLACTSTLPPVVESVVCVIEAVAPPRTSLSDTAPATPVGLPLLLPPGAVVLLPKVIVALIAELSCAITDTPPPGLNRGGREVASIKVDARLGTAGDLVRGQHKAQRQVLAPLLAGGGPRQRRHSSMPWSCCRSSR